MAEALPQPFPTEVWRTSWNNATPRELKALSASCRLFRNICQPLLFRSLSYIGPFFDEFDPRNPQRAVEKLKRSRVRLLSIVSSPHIPSMVQSWSFHSPTDMIELDTAALIRDYPAVNQVLALSLEINFYFSSTIGAYTNLSELRLTEFQCSPEFCGTLASLPRLTVMQLTDCDVICPFSSGSVALTALSCFAYKESRGWRDNLPERYHLVSTSRLEQVELFNPVEARAFLTLFAASGPLPRLVHLNVCLDLGAKDVFYRFIDCCPELMCILLEAPAGFGGVTLPETSVPTLHSFTGRIEIAGVFAGGRPVHDFKIREGGEDEGPVDAKLVWQGLFDISKSGDTVEDLTLPFISLDSSPMRLVSDPALFPKLKRLALFLQDTRPSADDDESVGDWETVGGSSEGSADEVIDVDEDDGYRSDQSTGWMPARMFNHLLRNQGENPEATSEDDDEEHSGHECSDCESDTSTSTDGSESELGDVVANPKTYEDLKLSSFQDFISSLANDSIPLPRNIRTFCIGQIPRCSRDKSMTDADITTVIEKLGARYPGLKKVVVGIVPRAWKRKGGVWKTPKPQPQTGHPFGHIIIGSFPL
ncbi:hypothetical protein C8R47DRAFT_35847 [Mycena vitilis]|nr:hypothetical protein C8R47DRAFT_35847 [Mycena vitilis]